MIKPLFVIFSLIVVPGILIAQMPAGAIAVYKLDNNAADISGNNYQGSLVSTSSTSNRFNNGNSATAFVAGSSVGTLPLALVNAISNDFTVGFWFRTTTVSPSSAHWYGGRALVDAEMCGVTTDWGTALIDGGKVCFGIGNPDITIKSAASGFNNGNWHFVTATRTRATGTIVLYVNGVQVASSAGTSTSPLTAPTAIRLASNPCVPGGVYTGDMDDIVFYNRPLSSVEATNLYVHLSAVVLPLRWISFTGELLGSQAKLVWEVEAVENNDYFEIEHSTDGVNFVKKGKLADGETNASIGSRTSYTFLDGGLGMGTHYYRIRQVDKDGRFSLSKTVQIRVAPGATGFYLRSNPVTDKLLLVNENQTRVSRIQVTNVSGQVLIDRNIQSTGTLIATDVSNLQPGYYLLKIYTGTKDQTLPWIKQ